MQNPETRDILPFEEALKVWLKIGFLSFGGPAGQIALMHKILVEEKRWIGESRFLHALNYCMLLPGPEAQQLATYIGWLMHRTRGGLAAGALFVLPGFLVMLTLSMFYAGFHDVGWVAALFFGLKSAVLAIVVEAVIRIGKKSLKNGIMVFIAAAAFVAIFFFNVPFPAIIFSAALAGMAGNRFFKSAFNAGGHKASKADTHEALIDRAMNAGLLKHTKPSLPRAVRVAIIGLSLWLAPVAACVFLLGWDATYTHIALFFSKMAVVTFGGAYAVLGYVAQEAVGTYHWLNPGEMLEGLGLAETTPGPLILVLQYVGFLATFRDAGSLPPMLAGTLGAVLTIWVTFVPCFLWIFLGGPYVEQLRGNRTLAAGLSAITAAVVGVVLNLAVWFALHALFTETGKAEGLGTSFAIPVWPSLDMAALLLAVVAAALIFIFRAGMIPTLAACALGGLLLKLLPGLLL